MEYHSLTRFYVAVDIVCGLRNQHTFFIIVNRVCSGKRNVHCYKIIFLFIVVNKRM